MALVEANTQVLSNLVKHEYPFKNLSRETVTLAVTDKEVLQVGQVVGKITASGKFVIAKETADDDSKAFYGVIVALPEGANNPWIASKTGDVKVVVLTEAPAMLNPEALILDESYSDETKKKALYATISAKGIALATVSK